MKTTYIIYVIKHQFFMKKWLKEHKDLPFR